MWLFLGLAAGVFLAAVLSYHEYRTVAGIADSVLRTEGSGRDSNGDIDISDISEEGSGRDKEMLLSDVLRSHFLSKRMRNKRMEPSNVGKFNDVQII